MTEKTDTVSGEHATRVAEHIRRWSRTYAGVGVTVAALVLFGGALGFRGVGPAGFDLANAASKVPSYFGKAPPHFLKNPHPFPRLLAGFLGKGLGLPALPALRQVSLFAVVAAVPAVWGLGRRLGGPGAGVAAAVVFAALPQVAGSATSVGPSAMYLGMWAWFLRLLVVRRHTWYTTIPLWLLGATLVLTWPPFVLWGAIWLYLELREAEYTDRAEDHLAGEYGAASLPFSIALSPFAVFVFTTLLHPSLWADPYKGWKAFGTSAMNWTGPAFQFAGETYKHARPPPWMGGILAWWTLPALVAALAAAGWVFCAVSSWRSTRSGRLVQRMCLWGLPLGCLLPWLTRGPEWGSIDFVLAIAPFLAALSGTTVRRGILAASATAREWVGDTASTGVRWTGSIAVTLLVLGTLVQAHPVQGSYYNDLAGGFAGAMEHQLPISRDSVYPVGALRRAKQIAGADSLAVLGRQRLVRKYVQFGLLEDVKPTNEPGEADARIRRLGRFKSGKSVERNLHALVDLTSGAAPLIRVDGVPIYWVEY